MSIILRQATIADVDLYFQWANQEHIRRFAFSNEAIRYDKHQDWFHRKIQSELCYMYVALAEGLPVGQIRFDIVKDEAFVDLHISSGFSGMGYGKRMLKQGLISFTEAYNNDVTIIGIVFLGNIASRKCFESNNFELIKRLKIKDVECLRFEWKSKSIEDQELSHVLHD